MHWTLIFVLSSPRPVSTRNQGVRKNRSFSACEVCGCLPTTPVVAVRTKFICLLHPGSSEKVTKRMLMRQPLPAFLTWYFNQRPIMTRTLEGQEGEQNRRLTHSEHAVQLSRDCKQVGCPDVCGAMLWNDVMCNTESRNWMLHPTAICILYWFLICRATAVVS